MTIIVSTPAETRGARLKGFKHRTAIIKADDLGSEPVLDCWWRLLEALDRRGVPISAGVVAGRIGHHPDGVLSRLVLQLRQGGHEVWNHSHSHRDFGTLALADQVDDLRQSQATIGEIFGARPHVFGAPFNSMNEATIQALEANSDFSAVYFARYPTRLETVPYFNLCPPEVVSGYYRQPDFAEFLPRYGRRQDQRPIVLQVHPPAWSEHGLHEFIHIVDWLIERDWQFVTFDDFIQYRREGEREGTPLTSHRAELLTSDERMTHAFGEALERPDEGAGQTDYNFDRFTSGTLHLHNFLRGAGFDHEGPRREPSGPIALDIGCGAGNWTVAYAGLSSKHRAVGMDTDERLVATIEAAARRLPAGDRISFKAGSILEIPAKDASFDHVICNNLLNYVPLQDALSEIRRVLKPGGVALLGVQNRDFWLKGFFDRLREGDLPGALRRIDQLGYQAARGGGLPPGANYATIWEENPLSLVAELVGLDRLSPILGEGQSAGRFLGTPLFTYYPLETRGPITDLGARFAAGKGGGPDLAGLADLFIAGAWRSFLVAVAGVCARSGGLIEDDRIQRMVTAAVALASSAGVNVAQPCAAIAARHGALRDAFAAYASKDYKRAAEALLALAAGNRRDLAGPVTMALYAAGDHRKALDFCGGAFGPRAGWTDDEWMVWLTAVTAAEGVEAGKRGLAAYLERGLGQIESRLRTADLAVMTHNRGLNAVLNTDELTVASLRVAIAALG
ncbi:MAG: methyltransferase domain-containing protein [Bauldia sp.]|nr:methyltransferase domain-containing protein [Bauldia sp.]